MNECVRIWKEAVAAHMEVLSRHLPVEVAQQRFERGALLLQVWSVTATPVYTVNIRCVSLHAEINKIMWRRNSTHLESQLARSEAILDDQKRQKLNFLSSFRSTNTKVQHQTDLGNISTESLDFCHVYLFLYDHHNFPIYFVIGFILMFILYAT